MARVEDDKANFEIYKEGMMIKLETAMLAAAESKESSASSVMSGLGSGTQEPTSNKEKAQMSMIRKLSK